MLLDKADELAKHFGIELRRPSYSILERYQVTDVKALGQPGMLNLLRLMMAFDALRSAYRWMELTEQESDPVYKSDVLLASITMSGWAWEAVKLLREGKKKGWLDRGMLKGLALRRQFDQLTKKPSAKPLAMLERIRNECFGHFDKRLATTFLEHYRDGKDLPPFFETTAGGRASKSRYPWSFVAFARHFSPDLHGKREALRRMAQVTDSTKSVLGLIYGFIEEVVKAEHLDLEPVETTSGK